MKKVLITTMILSFVLSVSVPAFAGELPQPIKKLINGTTEVLKSPLELFDHTKSEMDKSDQKIVGLFKGLLFSPFYVVKRAGHGIVDMVTFPIE